MPCTFSDIHTHSILKALQKDKNVRQNLTTFKEKKKMNSQTSTQKQQDSRRIFLFFSKTI